MMHDVTKGLNKLRDLLGDIRWESWFSKARVFEEEDRYVMKVCQRVDKFWIERHLMQSLKHIYPKKPLIVTVVKGPRYSAL